MRRWMPKPWWTPRYVLDRSRLIIEQRRHPSDPWLCREAVHILDDWLRSDDAMAEFGSGRSTLWFAQRVGHLTSVEDDRSWYDQTQATLADLGVDYRFCAGRDAYVGVAESFEPASLDVALVDGSWRDQCALAMVTALRPGGLLVIDNVNWYLPPPPRSSSPAPLSQHSHRWEQFAGTIQHWRRLWISNGVTDTALFFKPS